METPPSTPQPVPRARSRSALWIGLTCLAILLLCCCLCLVVGSLGGRWGRILLSPSNLLPTTGLFPSDGAAGWEAAPGDAQSLPDLVDAGTIDLDEIVAVQDGAFGPILRVTVTNPGTQVVVVTIPCGTILAPQNGDGQQMMVVQPASASIPAGGSATITLFVICIDANKATPNSGDYFSFGGQAEGDVLALAECACQDGRIAEANPLPLMGLQFTAWMLREGISPEALLASGEGAASEFLGGERGAQVRQLMQSIGGFTGDWLERCGIQPPG
jgi:hypothetical protein